jgi:hypothetical protein
VAVPRTERAPLLVRIDYLVTLHLAEPMAEHRAMGELVFAALARPDIELAGSDDVTAVRRRLALPASSGLVLSMRLPRERPEQQPQLVRVPLVLHADLVRPLEGVVVGPNDVPVMDAIVEVPALGISALTDPEGRFRFEATPMGGKSLKVSARKRRAKIEIDAVPGQPLTIRMPLEN